MLIAFAIFSILFLIDLLLLKVMPKYYFSIGIPIYKSIIEIKQNSTLKDIGVYIGISEQLVYKLRDNVLLFRTKFNYSTLYTIKSLSIVKGDIKLNDGKAYIVQRINLSTLYFILFAIYTFATEKIVMFGYVLLVIMSINIVISHLARNVEIKEIRKNIATYINQEKKVTSRWGD